MPARTSPTTALLACSTWPLPSAITARTAPAANWLCTYWRCCARSSDLPPRGATSRLRRRVTVRTRYRLAMGRRCSCRDDDQRDTLNRRLNNGEREILGGQIRGSTCGLGKLLACLNRIVYCDLSTSRSALRRESAGGVVRPNPRKFRQSGFQTSTVWCSPRLLI